MDWATKRTMKLFSNIPIGGIVEVSDSQLNDLVSVKNWEDADSFDKAIVPVGCIGKYFGRWIKPIECEGKEHS